MEGVALPQGAGTESRTWILEACHHKAKFIASSLATGRDSGNM